MREVWLDDVFEIVLVDRIDFGRDLERHLERTSYLDRPVRSLLRRDASKEGEVPSGLGVEVEEVKVDTVVDRGQPAARRQGFPLCIANRNEGRFSEVIIDVTDLVQVQSSMRGRYHGRAALPGKREREVIDVVVDHVKLALAIEDSGHFDCSKGDVVSCTFQA